MMKSVQCSYEIIILDTEDSYEDERALAQKEYNHIYYNYYQSLIVSS